MPMHSMRPLKMETTHKLVRLSERRSMWKVKAAMMAAPIEPAAVQNKDIQLAAARRCRKWRFPVTCAVRPWIMRPRLRLWVAVPTMLAMVMMAM